MAKQFKATLVSGSSYSLVTKSFEKGVPVIVNASEAEILRNEHRSFLDPQTKEQHVVNLFKVEEIVEEAADKPSTPKSEAVIEEAPGAPEAAPRTRSR